MKAQKKNITSDDLAKFNVVNDDNIATYPKEVQEMYWMIKEKGQSLFLTPKYYKTFFSFHKSKAMKSLREAPDKTISEIIIERLIDIPDFIPAEKILELTQQTIACWEEMRQKDAVTV